MKQLKKILVFALLFGLGSLLGFFLGEMIGHCLATFDAFPMALLWLAVTVVGGILTFCLQIALHEAGHLIGGLLTGYRFSSYRIGSLMLLREGDRFVWRRLSITGTGGQCLMAPPPLVDGKIPYVLYNLGGAMLNLLVALIFGLFWLAARDNPWITPFFACGALFGLMFALTNGIPLRMGMVDNDGRNAVMLGRNPDALRAFWLQMQINAEIASGKRLHEMPDAWFATDGLDMQNTMTATVAVFACNRLVDARQFDEADTRMRTLIGENNAILELHRRLMAADVMYIAWLQGDDARAASYNTPEQRKFMRAMKNFPSVVRTDFTEALLGTRDAEAAAKFAAQFEKIARSYPYPSDIASERMLMELARETADARH